MLRILEAKQDIREAQESFESAIRAIATETVPTSIGFQGGGCDVDVMWLDPLGIWVYMGYPPSEASHGGRYWNVFGIGKPGPSVGIVCEINPPFEGINRRVAGAFARDNVGRTAIVHRGKLNARGLDKGFFTQHYRGAWATVQDGDGSAKVVLVATIGSSEFPEHLRRFVVEVDRIKKLAWKQV